MASHSSAGLREHTSHVNQTTRTSTIVNALKRRAQAVLNDKSIDAQSRAIIRYALETNDPWLAELVRRADMGDTTEQLDFSQMPENNEDDSSDAKIEACVELICNAGSKASVALLVLMATLEKATHPKALANVAKHLVGLCLKSRTSLLDTVSTTRGSGWVAHQTCDFANGFELVCLTHPAGGTDCIQAGAKTFEARPPMLVFAESPSGLRYMITINIKNIVTS